MARKLIGNKKYESRLSFFYLRACHVGSIKNLNSHDSSLASYAFPKKFMKIGSFRLLSTMLPTNRKIEEGFPQGKKSSPEFCRLTHETLKKTQT